MDSLLLKKEGKLLIDGFKNKLNFNKNKAGPNAMYNSKIETLKTLLARCSKLYDAKHEIVRILVKTKKREDILV